MSELLEAGMVLCFDLSWPTSLLKSWRARTCKGKSLLFMIFIAIGYVCGIAAKLSAQNITYVLLFYVINLIMVSADIGLYIRNATLDRKKEQG